MRWVLAVVTVAVLGAIVAPAATAQEVRVRLLGADAAALRVQVVSSQDARVRVFARAAGVAVARARSVRLRARRARTVALRLTPRGRRALSACPAPRLTLSAQRGRRARRTVARRTARPPEAGGCRRDGAGRDRVLFSADFGAGLFGPPTAPYPSDVDDAIAIAMALNARGLEVDGISVQFGNNQAGPATPKTRELVHDVMGRRDVPIAQGAERALPPPGEPCVTDGVRLLAEQLRRGPAKVLATGPLTDVACLARAFPRAAANVTEVLAQVGARPGEAYDLNGRPALFSLNVSADPRAMEEVLTSPALADAAITASPYHLAGMLLFDDARVDRMGGDTPEGRWLRDNSRAFREFWRAAFADDGLRPWDQTLVYHLMRPSAYRVRDVGWRMVDCADPTGRNANPDCAGHGPTQFPTRDGEPKQLWLGDGPGQRPRARLRILDDYAAPADGVAFLDAVTALGR